MLRKVIIALVGILILLTFFFPQWIPRLLRRLGLFTGDVGRAGQELLTGEELERSPLARYEEKAGALVARRLVDQHPASADAAAQAAVAELGSRLAAHAARRHIHYRFAVLEGDEPNAFAVPGGWVFITRGMMQLCGGAPELIAGVLAHEIIHIDRRHALVSRAANAAVTAGLRLFLLGRGAIIGRMAQGLEQLMVRGYRQDQELEADLFGSRLARLAGFDPWGLYHVLELVRQAHPDGRGAIADVLQYFRSHPPLALRLEKLREGL
jgi:predicted Zn-dependent protease